MNATPNSRPSPVRSREVNFRQRGIKPVVAFHQRYHYPVYGFTHCCLSNHLDHIEALLGFTDYGKNLGGEIFFDAISYPPLQPIESIYHLVSN